MSAKKYTPEQVVSMLREAEVLLGTGKSISEGAGVWASPTTPTTAGGESAVDSG